MCEEAKWYVIHTYSGYEKLVAENINKMMTKGNVNGVDVSDIIKEVKVPTEKFKELRNGKYREVEKKLFPGYVIVKMILNDDGWLIIKNIKGVTGFVGDPHNPNSLSQEEIDKLGIEEKNIRIDYKAGDVVNIVSGAFEGSNGIVEEIDEEKFKVKVIVSVFGRNTSIELDLDKVILKN